MKRRTQLRAQSTRRRQQNIERARVREEVRARAGATGWTDIAACWYRPLAPTIRCSWRPDRRKLEVDEVRGGSYRSTEWLNANECRLTCPAHHDWKTDHPADFRAALDRYERMHPWPSGPTSSGP